MQRALALSLCLAVATATTTPVRADESLETPEADFRHVSDYAWFALGAAAGFVGHELGHMMMDVFFGKTVSFVGVSRARSRSSPFNHAAT